MVFKLTPKSYSHWKESVVHNFKHNGRDGTFPAVMFAGRGNLYGTTQSGGAYEDGTVFELLPNFDGSWVESVLYSFSGGSRGAGPYSLTPGAGSFYGTTTLSTGGYNKGLVFQLKP